MRKSAQLLIGRTDYLFIDMPHQLEVNDKLQDNERETLKYQNTYRLESCNPFKVDPVDKIVQTTMINKLEDISYDPTTCLKVCELIAADIRSKIKNLKFDRYKIAVTVTIIEKSGQSIQSSLGFIWDPQKDNYSTFTYEARTFHAYCCVFGIYHE